MKYGLLLFALFLFSCKNQKEMKKEKIEIGSILYEYEDSSVPPQYHRSYSLLVKKNSIEVKVDSYGSMITDTAITISETEFSNITATYEKLALKNTEKREPQGCVGGTGATVRVWDKADSLIMEGHVYFCGGKEYGTLSGDVKSLGDTIKSCIPDFEKLLKRQ